MCFPHIFLRESFQEISSGFYGGDSGRALLIALTTLFQYKSTFYSTYVESGVRRRTLAEKLRKIPLSYFGKKDLADLTNTIMTDCAMIETGSSHWIPELVGGIVSTTIIVISLFSLTGEWLLLQFG